MLIVLIISEISKSEELLQNIDLTEKIRTLQKKYIKANSQAMNLLEILI